MEVEKRLVMACCRREVIDILTYLIQRGANLDLADSCGRTALYFAAMDKKHLSMACFKVEPMLNWLPILEALH
jgi:ankyrin repeat protein